MARKTIHGQRKKDVTVTLTPEGVEMLDSRAQTLGISRSELIEQIARNQISSNQEHQLLGGILSQLIAEYQDQVATKKHEIEWLEARIDQFKGILEQLDQPTESE